LEKEIQLEESKFDDIYEPVEKLKKGTSKNFWDDAIKEVLGN